MNERMDDIPNHPEDTLMGADFWNDAAAYEALTERLDLHVDLTLHKRFPFNLGLEQGPRSGSVEEVTPTPTPKKRRRLSMPDSLGQTGFGRRTPVIAASSRLLDFARRPRSPSPLQDKMSWSPLPQLPPPSVQIMPGSPKELTVEELELPQALVPVLKKPDFPVSDAEPSPLKRRTPGFRGGLDWTEVSRSEKALKLDMFWPVEMGLNEIGCRDVAELKPLCQFRGLRSLKIVGMMQSHQSDIWMAAWLNLNLDELELGMALEPELSNSERVGQWKVIKEGWQMNDKTVGKPVYHGRRGDGELHPDFGYGEYLDKLAIEKAKVLALAMGHPAHRLTIKKLTLNGFVVDADPFLQWFDPKKLHIVQFKGHCIDAGFWLSKAMQDVVVLTPQKIDRTAVPVGIVDIDMPKDVNVVELNSGNVSDKALLGEYESSMEF